MAYLLAEDVDTLELEDASGRYLLSESPIVITPPSLPNATAEVPYAQQLVATGTSGPYVFSVSFGVLPPGLTLSAAGLLAGTIPLPAAVWLPPTIPESIVDAPYPTTTITVVVPLVSPALFTVRATDVSAIEDLLTEDGASLQLEDATGHYVIEASQNLYGEIDYSLTTAYWISPIQYTASPRVPSCMSFSPSGVLAGTPMQVRSPGPWTVTATDAIGHTLSHTYTLTVRPSP